MSMKQYDVAVIGAGPAGMMAAITAARNGKRVILIERNPQLGRKLLATGNGRCNLTNADISIDRYHGGDPAFIQTVLGQFDQNATIDFFSDLGLVVKEEDNGRIFPRTNQASSVVEVLKQTLVHNNVDILLDTVVVGIEKQDLWRVFLYKKDEVYCDKLIIATGGKAAHQFGSTGDGWLWARQFGHTLTEYNPALVPVETLEQWPKELQGLRVEARVWVTVECRAIGESSGDVLFTSYGVSGPAVMAHSGAIAPVLKASEVQLHIDLFPDMTLDQLDQIIQRLSAGNVSRSVQDALVGLLPSGLIPVILQLAGISESSQTAEVPGAKQQDIAMTLKDLTVTVSKLRPFKEAQVTAGGLDSSQIDSQTLESKLAKGLYFAGEMLDADGDSGGFNLQWAWSSGYAAGKASGSI